MRTVVIQPVFEAWRTVARDLLAQRIPPDEVLWSDDAQEPGLFAPTDDAAPSRPLPKVPPAFLEMARSVAA